MISNRLITWSRDCAYGKVQVHSRGLNRVDNACGRCIRSDCDIASHSIAESAILVQELQLMVPAPSQHDLNLERLDASPENWRYHGADASELMLRAQEYLRAGLEDSRAQGDGVVAKFSRCLSKSGRLHNDTCGSRQSRSEVKVISGRSCGGFCNINRGGFCNSGQSGSEVCRKRC